MSSNTNNVDERVVQMTFNNAEFEKGVSTTLSTLERLKRSLNFKARPTGLEDLGRAVGLVEKNLQPMADDIDHIANRFTALGIVGDQIIRNLTNRVVAFGESMVKSVTVEPLTSGFSEYETQMKSIQTILANTGMEGTKGVAKVNAALDELNTYADKTIYNFSQMTENIGRFTASGVKLQPAVDAIKGTANLAALSGSNAEQANRAMYNLSQALSTGTLKLMDWNSVVNAGMGGTKFQDMLIRTAATMDGYGDKIEEWKKKNVDAFGSFRDSLSKGWITSDVLQNALHNFTYDVEEGTEDYTKALKELTEQGYSEEVAKDILKIARQATEAATKVRTFTQLIDTLKEALGSGWTESWRLIFGDFNEATELWTGINDLLSGFIEKTSKARNDILQFWHDAESGGRAEFIDALKELVYDIALIIKPIKMAWDDVFGAFNKETILEWTHAFKRFADGLHPSIEGFYSIHRIATSVFKILKYGFEIVGKGIGLVFKLGQPLLYLADALLVTIGNILESIANNGVLSGFLSILEKISNIISFGLITGINFIANGIIRIANALKTLKLSIFKKDIDGINDGVNEAAKGIPILSSAIEVFSRITNGAKSGFEAFVRVIATGIVAVLDFFSYISKLPVINFAFIGVKQIIKAILASLITVGVVIKNIVTAIGNIDLTKIKNPLEFLQKVGSIIISNVIGGFRALITILEEKIPIFKTLESMVMSIVNAFKNGIGVIGDFFKTLKLNGGNANGIREGLASIVEGFKEFIAIMTPARLGALGITAFMLALSVMFLRVGNAISNTMGQVSAVIGIVKNGLKDFVDKQNSRIIEAAKALLMVSSAIAIIAGIEPDKLWQAVGAIVAVTAVMGTFVILTELVKKRFSSAGDVTQNITNLGGIALMVLEMEAALAIMVNTIKELKGFDIKGMEQTLLAVLGMFTVFMLAAIGLDRFKVGFSKGTLSILLMAASIRVICDAVKQLQEVDPIVALVALKGMIPLFATIAAIAFAAKGIGITTGLGIILTTKAIQAIMPQIKELYHAMVEFPYWDSLMEYIEKYQVGFGMIGILAMSLTAIAGIFGKGLQKAGTGILAMAASMLVVVYALDMLTNVCKSANIGTAMLVMNGIFLMITTWLGLASIVPEKSAILKVGVAIAIMAGTLLIINLAIAQMADMLTNQEGVLGATVLIGGLMLLIGHLIKLATDAGSVKGVFGIIASVMAGLTMMIAEIIALSMMKPLDLIMPLITVGTLLYLINKIFDSLSGETSFNKGAVIAMGIAVGGIVLIISSLYALAELNPTRILAASASISLVIFTLNGIFKTLTGDLSNVNASFGTIMLIATAIGSIAVIAWSLQLIAEYHWQSLLGAAAAISLVMAALTISIKVIVSMGASLQQAAAIWPTLLAFCGAVAVASASLYLLTALNDRSGDIVNAAIGLSVVLATIAGLIVLFSAFNAASIAGALIGATAIVLFIGTLVLEMFLVYKLIEGINAIFDVDVFDSLREFAGQLGSVVGSFVASFGESASDALPKIGENLSKFAKNAEDFFTITKGVDGATTAGVSNLAGAIVSMTAGGFFESLTSWITGESQIDKMRDIFPKLAQGLIAYNNAISEATQNGADFSKIEESTAALELIVELAKKIPNAGGLVGEIFGENDADVFGGQLEGLADGLRKYTNIVNGIKSYEGVEPSLNALKMIRDQAEQIPNAGGKLAEMVGDNNIDDFGARLVGLAKGLRDFATITASVDDWGKPRSAISILGDIVEISKKIPNGKNGDAFNFASFFAGDNDIDLFGRKLGTLADGIVTFAEKTEYFNGDKVDDVSDSIEKLVDSLGGVASLNTEVLYSKIPTITSFLNKFTDAVKEILNSCSDELTKAMNSLIEDTIKDGNTKNADFRKLGVGYVNSIGNGIISSSTSLGNDIKSLLTNALSKVKEEVIEMANTEGAEIGQELVNGIVGPKGIDPDENVAANDYSHKVVDDATTLLNNAPSKIYDNVKDTWNNFGGNIGSLIPESITNADWSVDGITNKLMSLKGTVEDIASGNFSLTDAIGGVLSGSEQWNILGGKSFFKEFTDIGEGTDVESSAFGDMLGGLTDDLKSATSGTKGLGKGLSGASKELSSAKEKLKEYNKYLKYSAKVEEEFAKTTGAAMTVFTNDTPINNAKVAIAALAEQIYADSKKIQDAVEDTEDTAKTAEDRAVEVMKAFNEDYESIKNSVGDSIDLFKNFYAEMSTITKPVDILRNAQSQIDGYNRMLDKYDILAARGLPSDLIQEFAEKGAESISTVNSLLGMSHDQLEQYISLWEESRNLKEDTANRVMSARATTAIVKQLKEQVKNYKPFNKAVKEAYTNYKKLSKEIIDGGGDPSQDSELVQILEEVNRLAIETNTNLKALDESLSDSSAENAASALELIEKYTEANAVIDKYNTTFSETEQSVRQLIDDQLGGFETFTKKTGISAQDMLDILKSQAKGVNQWGKELASLGSRGLSEDILKDLEKLGPEGYEKVHAFYKMTKDEIKEANEWYAKRNTGADMVSRMVATSFADAAVGGIDAYKEQLEIAANNETEFKEVIDKFTTNVTSEITEQTSAQIIAGGKDVGKYLTDSIAEGVEKNKSKSTSAAKGAAKEATDGAASTLKEEGEKTINPMVVSAAKGAAKVAADTIKTEGENTINPAINTVMDNAKSTVKTGIEEINKELKLLKTPEELLTPITSTIASGNFKLKTEEKKSILPKSEEVATKSTIAYKPENPFSLTKKDGEKDSGNYTSGLTSGFKMGKKDTDKEAGNVAKGVNDVFSRTWDMNSPSKVAKSFGEYFIQGLIDGIVSMMDKLKSVSGEAADVVTNKIGNVDINARPIVYNDDGTYSTTSTAFGHHWVGDEETGHYRIGHFATIMNDGTRLTDQELDDYIDMVLGSDDPFGVDAQMRNLLYEIVDNISTGEYITDQNIEQAFQEATAWDENMHELQDSMYRDKAAQFQTAGTKIGDQFIAGVRQSLIDGITDMIYQLKQVSEESALVVVDMFRNAVTQADALDDVAASGPVITPVINLSAAQNGFNVLGNMFDASAFKVGFNPQLNQINPDTERTRMMEAMNASKYNDSRVVGELANLRQDLNNLGDKVGNLQVVMDSGPLVGAIAPKMDTELGTIYRRRNRG